MTWVTTTDGPSQERLTPSATGTAPEGSSSARGAGTDPSPETWNVPQAMWHEEPGWDDRRVLVVDAAALRALGTAAAMEGYLWIPLERPRPAHRGKLALHIEESIESALQQRGAPFPGVGASTDLDASLGDQLYRARLVEMRGIALGIPDLGGVANVSGVLDAEDSAVLRWWLAAAMDRPVRVVLSAENRAYRVYPSPVGFGTLIEGLRGAFSDAPSPRAPSAETAQSVAAMELSDLPPAVVEDASDFDGEMAADVELPELDQALGLAPAPEPAAVEQLSVAEAEAETTDEARDTVVAAASADTTQPAVGEPAVAEPAVSEPAVSEPAVSEPAVGEPAVAEPAVAEPAVAEPAVAEVAVPEAAPAEPAVDPVAPEATPGPVVDAPAEAAVASGVVRPARPVVKSSISMDAARRAATSRRIPFVVAAEDDSAFPEGELPETKIPEPSDSDSDSGSVENAAEVTAPSVEAGAPSVEASAPSVEASAPSVEASAPSVEASAPSVEASAPSVEASAPSVEASAPAADDPFDAFARQHWKSWIRELESARGPKPLALIERMFVTAYTRLDAAVQRGIGDDSARDALETWRSSFSKSYTEAFDALRLRGKRPTMVLDVPEVAQRVGRLHGARRVQLLLVDGMRFDLGMMVQDRLKQCAEASLTERMLLWSALPSNTTNQLELLGKGPDGLRDMAPQDEEAPAVVARGRAAHSLRRIRTGRRELFKLDIVEAALREVSEGGERRVRASLPSIAEDVAAAVADHFAKQAPRTLVVLFGDHGFRLHDDAAPGEEVTQGGSSPEEVLVPAFAWLTGAVH